MPVGGRYDAHPPDVAPPLPEGSVHIYLHHLHPNSHHIVQVRTSSKGQRRRGAALELPKGNRSKDTAENQPGRKERVTFGNSRLRRPGRVGEWYRRRRIWRRQGRCVFRPRASVAQCTESTVAPRAKCTHDGAVTSGRCSRCLRPETSVGSMITTRGLSRMPRDVERPAASSNEPVSSGSPPASAILNRSEVAFPRGVY